MRTYLILLSLLCISLGCLAQSDSEPKRVDILELENGTKIIGTILYEDQDLVRVYNETVDTLEIAKGEIAGIERFKLLNGPKAVAQHLSPGLYAAIQLGSTLADEGKPHINANVGMRLTRHLTAALQLGYDFNAASQEGLYWNYDFYTVGGYVRYTFTEMKFRPYVSGYAGYGIYRKMSWLQNQSGGFNFEPGIGVQMATSFGTQFTLSIHQYIQPAMAESSYFDFLNNPITERVDITLNRTVLKLGVEF